MMSEEIRRDICATSTYDDSNRLEVRRKNIVKRSKVREQIL